MHRAEHECDERRVYSGPLLPGRVSGSAAMSCGHEFDVGGPNESQRLPRVHGRLLLSIQRHCERDVALSCWLLLPCRYVGRTCA